MSLTGTRVERPAGTGRAIMWLAVGAVAVGAVAALSVEAALGGALVVAALVAFLRSEQKSEVVAGLYWVAFCVYETILSSVSLSGFFYPFYAAFILSIGAALFGSGLRVRPSFFWLFFAFLALVATSFVGFSQPLDFPVIQRVLAYLMGVMFYLQFRGRRGVVVVAGAAVAGAAAVAVWVIVSAIQGGFAYRGDISVNENVAAFYIGLGFVIAAAGAVHALGLPKRRLLGLGALLTSGVLAYALLLLASRGMTIAVGLALLAILTRMAVQEPRRLAIGLALLAMSAVGILLPGGEGLVQRFTGERVESGGSRTPIWLAVGEAYREGDVKELLIGNGFESSAAVVQRGFGTLTSTHNAYLEMLYEFGLLGLALFLAMHVAAVLVCWGTSGGLGLAGFALAVFLLGSGVTSTAPDGFLYWAALALALAVATWGAPRAKAPPAPSAGRAASGQHAPN